MMNRIEHVDGVADMPAHCAATVVPSGVETVYVSGQVGVAPDGTVPATFTEQAHQAWRNLIAVLAAAGCTLDDVAQLTFLVSDRSHRAENRTIRDHYLGGRGPAMHILVTDLWDERWMIEIAAVAVRSPR